MFDDQHSKLQENQEQAAPAEPIDAHSADQVIVDLKEQLLRALADAENIRKRSIKEKEDALKFAVTGFARELLSVADNFERALDQTQNKTIPAEFKGIFEGIQMTHNELLRIFSKFGIETIAPQDQPFDSHLHQAVFEVPDANKTPGTVVQVVQKGYTLHDRLLRPAMVGIAQKPQT